MKRLIEHQAEPITKERIKADLVQLGVRKGMILCVHSSLSSIGWVNGGAIAVVQAMMDILTDEGTLIMPAQTLELSDPADWINPPVPYSGGNRSKTQCLHLIQLTQLQQQWER